MNMDRTLRAEHLGAQAIGSGNGSLPIEAPEKRTKAKSHSKSRIKLNDPIVLIRNLAIRLYSFWVSRTYPFASVGPNLSIHYRTDLSRSHAHRMKLGRSVVLDKDMLLRVHVPLEEDGDPVLIVEDGSVIGPRCIMSAKNLIHI